MGDGSNYDGTADSLAPGIVRGLDALAQEAKAREAAEFDPRCWACTRRKGTTTDGRAPVCQRHYVALRLRMPVRLLTKEDAE